jgi:hypothetical protein
LTIRSLKGCDLPGVPVNGATVGGLKLNGMTTDAEAVYARGWTLALRGPLLLFISAPAKDGSRRVFVKPLNEFDLGFRFEEGEALDGFQRWDSHPAEAKKDKK